MVHPASVGFTARYEWHGRSQVVVWRHCGEDARQGRTNHVDGRRSDAHTVVQCEACGLRYETACLWTLAAV